jgi:hypothetical protein
MRETLDQRTVSPGAPFIEKLREVYPPLLTVAQYCEIRNCCPARAYQDFKTRPGLAVKDGRRVLRDVALQLIAELPSWVPEKERAAHNRPYERSLGRIKAGTNLSAKPLPAPSASAVKRRRRQPQPRPPANSEGAPAS